MNGPVIFKFVDVLHLIMYGTLSRTGMVDGLYDGPIAFIVTAIIAGKTYTEYDGCTINLAALILYCIEILMLCTCMSKYMPALNLEAPVKGYHNYCLCIPSTICILKEIYEVTLKSLISDNHVLMYEFITFIQRRWMQGIIITLLSRSVISDTVQQLCLKHLFRLPQTYCSKFPMWSAGYKRIIIDTILAMVLITSEINHTSVSYVTKALGMVTILTVMRFVALQRSTSHSNNMLLHPQSNNMATECLLQNNGNNGTNDIQIMIEQIQPHNSHRSNDAIQQNHYYAMHWYHMSPCAFPQYCYVLPYSQQNYSFNWEQNFITSTQYPPGMQHSPSFYQNTSQCFTQQQSLANSNKVVANVVSEQFIYSMKSHPHGISVIINNEKFNVLSCRFGTSVDAHNLENLFHYLGFVTQCHSNKTHIEMRQLLYDVAAMNHSNYDCLVVTILTHGDYGDVLYGTTGQGIVIQEVIETFSGTRCPTLIGKPKIFIIQACRGRRRNQTVQSNATNDDGCDMIDSGHPNISDYLVAYSTIPGHVSFRNNKIGSIFISTLVEIFQRYAAYEDIDTMLQRVNNEVTKYKPQGDGLQDSRQSTEVRSSLRGKLYFNPGN